MGLTLLRMRRIQRIDRRFDTALKINGISKAWYNKGRAFEMLGEKNKSTTLLGQARKLIHCFIQN
jgi:hypothetical protein